MFDLVLCSVPRLEIRAPLVGPALLKAACEKAEFKVKCIDFNLDLWHRLNEKWKNVLNDSDLTFRYEEFYEDFKKDLFNSVLDDWVETLLSINTRYIGITCFSQRSEFVIRDLCRRLRAGGKKIVLGGPCTRLSKQLWLEGLADFYIWGDAEISLPELLKGNFKAPGINDDQIQQIDDLNSIPTPDYGDYFLDRYPKNYPRPNKDRLGASLLYITGSRGCVRSCTFCTIGRLWKKFRFRDGENIAREMISHYEKYNISRFYFTDSLINGSLRLLESMCRTLAEYRERTQVNLRWQAQFICRPGNQMKPELYDLMKRSGCILIHIGIESGSEKVREHMKKQFSNADIYRTMEQLLRVRIPVTCMMFVGYPTETEEDFQQTLKLFHDLLPYKETINVISLGVPMVLPPESPIYSMIDELGIEYHNFEDWRFKDNDIRVRLDRWLRLHDTTTKLGYNVLEKYRSYVERQYEQLFKSSQFKTLIK